MNTREVIEALVDSDVEDGIHLVQALDEDGNYFHVLGVEHRSFIDIDGTSHVSVIKLRKI